MNEGTQDEVVAVGIRRTCSAEDPRVVQVRTRSYEYCNANHPSYIDTHGHARER